MKTLAKHIYQHNGNTCNSLGNMYSWVTSEMVSSLVSFQKKTKNNNNYSYFAISIFIVRLCLA